MTRKNHRDAGTGKWTTAKDAAKRPNETVAETVPTRHETPDDAGLRRLAEARPMPGSDWYEFKGLTKRYILSADAAFIAAASPATVLGLLDRLAHMTEARDNARAEVERLTALVAEVRATAEHYDGRAYAGAAAAILRVIDAGCDPQSGALAFELPKPPTGHMVGGLITEGHQGQRFQADASDLLDGGAES